MQTKRSTSIIIEYTSIAMYVRKYCIISLFFSLKNIYILNIVTDLLTDLTDLLFIENMPYFSKNDSQLHLDILVIQRKISAIVHFDKYKRL